MRLPNAPAGVRATLMLMSLTCLAACGDDSDEEEDASASNHAPTISGTAPATAQIGMWYSFMPAASDPDGDALQFTATRLPPWAALDGRTGRISGVPEPGEEGSYTQICISVSDGTTSTALTPFAITVANPAGSATLSWLPPTENADGTSLMDLSGYRIRYGRNAADPELSLDIDNPSINVYVVEQLGAGTWYFEVVALNSRGVESRPTSIGSKRIS
jgi:hypothetical protein